jgi:hypothetical protein
MDFPDPGVPETRVMVLDGNPPRKRLSSSESPVEMRPCFFPLLSESDLNASIHPTLPIQNNKYKKNLNNFARK